MGRKIEYKHFKIKMDMYGNSKRVTHWEYRVVFICIFFLKDSSHSVCTQLVGPYLQAALLEGAGAVFHGEDSLPLLCLLLPSAEWFCGDNVNLITTCECVLYE